MPRSDCPRSLFLSFPLFLHSFHVHRCCQLPNPTSKIHRRHIYKKEIIARQIHTEWASLCVSVEWTACRCHWWGYQSTVGVHHSARTIRTDQTRISLLLFLSAVLVILPFLCVCVFHFLEHSFCYLLYGFDRHVSVKMCVWLWSKHSFGLLCRCWITLSVMVMEMPWFFSLFWFFPPLSLIRSLVFSFLFSSVRSLKQQCCNATMNDFYRNEMRDWMG